MQTSIDISTKSDILNFIIFKRRLRQQLQHLYYVFIFTLFIALIVFCIYHKNVFIKITNYTKTTISNIANQLFEVEVKQINIFRDKNSILDDNEVELIRQKLSDKKITKNHMMSIIDDVISKNMLIDKMYIRKVLANGNLNIFIKEKKIIGIMYSDECMKSSTGCQKHIITKDNQIITYHKIKDNMDIMHIYGKIGTVNLQKIHKALKKYDLLNKISYINFYSSGRFDVMLNNKLLLKFPSTNWSKTIEKFNKLNSEYLLSDEIQRVKYLDFRVPDKIFIGS